MAETRVTDPVEMILKNKGRAIWSVAPDTLVYDAIGMMSDKNIGACLVVWQDKLVGIISERDYARKVLLKGKSSKTTQVQEIMSSPVTTVTPHHTVDECMRIITNARIRHLPVVDGERIIGVISIGDLVNWIISVQQETIHYLESYITGRYPG